MIEEEYHLGLRAADGFNLTDEPGWNEKSPLLFYARSSDSRYNYRIVTPAYSSGIKFARSSIGMIPDIH